jgi:hypothetical protein
MQTEHVLLQCLLKLDPVEREAFDDILGQMEGMLQNPTGATPQGS